MLYPVIPSGPLAGGSQVKVSEVLVMSLTCREAGDIGGSVRYIKVKVKVTDKQNN